MTGLSIGRPRFAAWLRAHSKDRPAMELRDFFARLTHEEVFDELVEVNRLNQAEIGDAINRAGQSVPLIAAAIDIGALHQAAGQAQAASDTVQQVRLVVAMHRLAEKLGYEW